MIICVLEELLYVKEIDEIKNNKNNNVIELMHCMISNCVLYKALYNKSGLLYCLVILLICLVIILITEY